MLQHNKFYVESPDEAILRKLAKDPVIFEARVLPEDANGNDFQVGNSCNWRYPRADLHCRT